MGKILLFVELFCMCALIAEAEHVKKHHEQNHKRHHVPAKRDGEAFEVPSDVSGDDSHGLNRPDCTNTTSVQWPANLTCTKPDQKLDDGFQWFPCPQNCTRPQDTDAGTKPADVEADPNGDSPVDQTAKPSGDARHKPIGRCRNGLRNGWCICANENKNGTLTDAGFDDAATGSGDKRHGHTNNKHHDTNSHQNKKHH